MTDTSIAPEQAPEKRISVKPIILPIRVRFRRNLPLNEKERRRFEFIRDNPEFLRQFIECVLKLVAAGRIHFSSRTILEHLRFCRRIQLKDDGSPYRVNDHISPTLGRIAQDELGNEIPPGFFSQRQIEGEWSNADYVFDRDEIESL